MWTAIWLRGLPRAGTAEFVVENEIIEKKILHQLKISLRPALLLPIRTSQAKITRLLDY